MFPNPYYKVVFNDKEEVFFSADSQPMGTNLLNAARRFKANFGNGKIYIKQYNTFRGPYWAFVE